jgi:FMN-dependent NADH-azoreductase
MKILHIDSSVTGTQSVSRSLTREVVEKLVSVEPAATLVYRDLVGEPLSHYTAVLRVHGVTPDVATLAQKHELEVGDAILDEFLASDVIVIGAPMYNFSIPSQLKAWIDLICVAGKTFSYGPSGVKGLCGGKRVIIVSTRGGIHSDGSPTASYDFQEKYLEKVFGFLGITDIDIVRAEGVAIPPDGAATARKSAETAIAALG